MVLRHADYIFEWTTSSVDIEQIKELEDVSPISVSLELVKQELQLNHHFTVPTEPRNFQIGFSIKEKETWLTEVVHALETIIVI